MSEPLNQEQAEEAARGILRLAGASSSADGPGGNPGRHLRNSVLEALDRAGISGTDAQTSLEFAVVRFQHRQREALELFGHDAYRTMSVLMGALDDLSEA